MTQTQETVTVGAMVGHSAESFRLDKIEKAVDSLSYHKPDEETQGKIETVRALGQAYVKAVLEILQVNRDFSLFITHFEDAQQRAIRSLVVPQ